MGLEYFVQPKYMSLEKTLKTLGFAEIFKSSFLSLLVLAAGAVFFILAHEYRALFLDSANGRSETDFKIRTLYEKNLSEKIKKAKQMVFAQSLHRKAVELVGHYVRRSKLREHLVRQYEQSYGENLDLQCIPEEENVHRNLIPSSQKGRK